MPTEAEVMELADKLTEAQREAVLDYTNRWVPTFLVQQGIVKECGHCGGYHRTPLGLAVRATLQDRGDAK